MCKTFGLENKKIQNTHKNYLRSSTLAGSRTHRQRNAGRNNFFGNSYQLINK